MTYAHESKRTDDQVRREAEFKALCAGNPVAEMMLALHRLDETGQCSDCSDVVAEHVWGYEYDLVAAPWPCDTVNAVRHAVLGWTAEQVTAVEDYCQRQFRTDTGTPHWRQGEEEAVRTRREAWVTSGIPAHRAVLYVAADIPLDEARTHEAAGLTSEDLDASLSTLVALL